MKLRVLLCLTVTACCLLLAACQLPVELPFDIPGLTTPTPTPDPDPDPKPIPDSGYLDPTHRTGTYKVEFKLFDKTVTHFYEEGEMPEPPTVENVVDKLCVHVFTCWSQEIAPVTGNTVYEARYGEEEKYYTAKFIVANGRTVSLKVKAGTTPTPPVTPDSGNLKFVCWDTEVGINYDNVTYTAIYTDVTTPEGMRMAWNEEVSGPRIHSTFQGLHMMTSIYTLVLQEYKNPQSDLIARRAADHLSALVSDGAGMNFTCSTNWQYSLTAATIAMAKKTPSVWNKIDYATRTRIDTLMEALAYICSFGTSDQNAYKTGPSLKGNYGKEWNPNYRLGNIPVITFVTYYFGDGNLEYGANKVNTMLTSFNETVYNKMINRFIDYNWELAYDEWTTEGIELNGVVSDSSAKNLLVNGGNAYGLSVNGQQLEGCGGGKGVNNGGLPYTYRGIPLERADEILRHVVEYNFSGGTVKSDHWFEGRRVAWILDGTKTPYEGKEGMMLEFASGNRSSTVYCDHDFTMVIPLLSCARELYRYDENGKIEKDAFGNPVSLYDCTKDVELWGKIQVGTEDFIYKFTHGYMCYSTGSYGVSHEEHHVSGASRGYTTVKALWRYSLLPLGTENPCD